MGPDLNCAQVQDATVKIQSAYKGFKTRQQIKKEKEIMPDLKSTEVQDATLKIQSAYKGFRVRKELKQKEEEDKLAKEEEQKRKQIFIRKTEVKPEKVSQKVKEEPKE